jgi:5-methylcytosine-specific restriction enzyme A
MTLLPRRCRRPGCTERTRSRSGYCQPHERQYQQQIDARPERKSSQAFYQSREWKRLRKIVLQSRPICDACGREPATHVDHRTPISQGGAPLDLANLQALGARCHSAKTAREDGGFGNRRRKVRGG